MANAYSMNDLLDFLEHAGDRGLMPAATAQALAVASRNVLGVLGDQEKKDLSQHDLDSVVKRFNNKRARDFNPSSLKEYGRRVHRAIDLFLKWREDPANFTVKTRATSAGKKARGEQSAEAPDETRAHQQTATRPLADTFETTVPIRPGLAITLLYVPYNLSKTEAERVANFVKGLVVEP